MKQAAIYLTIVLAVIFTSLQVKAEESSTADHFLRSHQAGIRLGFWSNQGDTHPAGGTGTDDFSFETKINKGSFYFEGFYDYRLSAYLAGEASLGIVNRGSVTISQGLLTDIGNLQIYSVLFQAKLYPIARLKPKFQPYVTIGGGLYYAWRNVQLTTATYSYSGFEQESATRFGYSLGGGLDWPISNALGLDLNVRYSPIEFNDPIVTVNDYSAFTLALGIKYLYASGK